MIVETAADKNKLPDLDGVSTLLHNPVRQGRCWLLRCTTDNATFTFISKDMNIGEQLLCCCWEVETKLIPIFWSMEANWLVPVNEFYQTGIFQTPEKLVSS